MGQVKKRISQFKVQIYYDKNPLNQHLTFSRFLCILEKMKFFPCAEKIDKIEGEIMNGFLFSFSYLIGLYLCGYLWYQEILRISEAFVFFFIYLGILMAIAHLTMEKTNPIDFPRQQK